MLIAFYIYSRDRYEKEPLSILLKALIAGVIIVLPVLLIERLVAMPAERFEGILNAAYTAFVIAALSEEGMKFGAFLIFFWKNKNYNERFDGIIYAVYIALGFAGVENILYVFSGGYSVGLVRALTAVPAHALFGIVMGFYLGKAKFSQKHMFLNLVLAFFIPFLFHGLYDFLLMANSPAFIATFIPIFIYFWISGFKKMTIASDGSSFRDETDSAASAHIDLKL
jgi:RsiW-degrading membrane proteinase PrsW (M82 family)